jgi:hypothetical protein
MQMLADAQAELAEQGERKQRIEMSQKVIADSQFSIARMRETDPVKRMQMEQERAIEDMREEFRRRGDESGKRFSDEMQKIKELEDRRQKAPPSMLGGVNDPSGLLNAMGADVDNAPDALRIRRDNAVAALKSESAQDLRELEATLAKIREEYSRKITAAESARDAEGKRKTLLDEEKSLRDQLRGLGSVSGQDFLTTSNTAIGGFTTAQRNAGAQVTKHLQQQTEIQRRIEKNTADQAKLLEDIRDSGGGWR